MPLSFNSQSHGSVAFGFFNIESDMLLLEHLFFFADEFCARVQDLAEPGADEATGGAWKVYSIRDPRRAGDLMGAIQGIRYTGFIGALYRRFPFPDRPEDFKQKAEGAASQEVVKSLITPYAEVVELDFVRAQGGGVQIGEFQFDEASFKALLDYVWRGGFPRWKDEMRPGYVTAMGAPLVPDDGTP